MPGYLIFEIDITDPAAYAHYRDVAGPILAAGGGRFVLSSENIEPLEGDWLPASLSVVEFPSAAVAREFYYSDDYQKVIELRKISSRARGILLAT
ncbi:DUF1330 domain-containing protein [Microvirga puerhi]|uniref:DUF1330 domain-containing protein n=1 Tax=Microvirga puerhi TaxID=2876078 RepID=A0ABS7VWP2_9HYPH|nr:DUF1330 domain-containing protein [Microvirga puerhi]MBZ6079283.1 DUF1330 domain-containing protein [Microvirga puerhi]